MIYFCFVLLYYFPYITANHTNQRESALASNYVLSFKFKNVILLHIFASHANIF